MGLCDFDQTWLVLKIGTLRFCSNTSCPKYWDFRILARHGMFKNLNLKLNYIVVRIFFENIGVMQDLIGENKRIT